MPPKIPKRKSKRMRQVESIHGPVGLNAVRQHGKGVVPFLLKHKSAHKAVAEFQKSRKK
jgi:hypothetical protein